MLLSWYKCSIKLLFTQRNEHILYFGKYDSITNSITVLLTFFWLYNFTLSHNSRQLFTYGTKIVFTELLF